ncbi:TIM21-domain-containing protein [Basidiobolus meristosporus CBS 931.73]|uniref:Mitochondrial import inner membrane translocase subunit Tim21 n=1 Tax=Basidiobolus meristosporus CBS 931.73 TaxID=1314790 RepID=A0A1Y1VXU9_9FUNG|nr:TIM21-domain-containing protein [Basidiobolus meristosporus CBS 931.73]|eukprot:ORX66101.1 TIM21-domain-containing protein [Basidiobolus meristosporus CBS 931.73]
MAKQFANPLVRSYIPRKLLLQQSYALVNKRCLTVSTVGIRSTAGVERKQITGYLTKRFASNKSLVEGSGGKQWSELTTGEKVVAAGKTTTNLGVIALGVGILGTIVYYLSAELFGSESSTHVFGDALDKIRANDELQAVLGNPIKGYGEPSSSQRRRNRRIASQVVDDATGTTHMLMRFFVEGPDNTGEAHLDMTKVGKGKWEYRYLYVDVPGRGLPSKRVVVEHHSFQQ